MKTIDMTQQLNKADEKGLSTFLVELTNNRMSYHNYTLEEILIVHNMINISKKDVVEFVAELVATIILDIDSNEYSKKEVITSILKHMESLNEFLGNEIEGE